MENRRCRQQLDKHLRRIFRSRSIGSIAVADSDPNVVYVGTGSACPRGNISVGDGIYKSTDAGKTWKHIGLRQAGQIGHIRVHPNNPDLVYVAALGHIFGPNEERGVFRSKDGGETWEKILYINEETGINDLAMDTTNPRILYAAAWRVERKPWALLSGNEDGGIFKIHGWRRHLGKARRRTPHRVWSARLPLRSHRPIRTASGLSSRPRENGVAFTAVTMPARAGQRINGEAKLRQRPWYYLHIFADPKDENTVYALNTGFYKSIDGGKTFPIQSECRMGTITICGSIPTTPTIMINANDGGANVSFDGGKSWSWQMNQPTAEIYRVFVDNLWPYRVYGPQQDNSTISVPSHGMVAWNRMPAGMVRGRWLRERTYRLRSRQPRRDLRRLLWR